MGDIHVLIAFRLQAEFGHQLLDRVLRLRVHVLIAFRLQAEFGPAANDPVITSLAEIEVLIAFRLLSEFGLIQSTQLPARMGRSLNRLSASVRIWTWKTQKHIIEKRFKS